MSSFYSRSNRCATISHPECHEDEPIYFLGYDEKGHTELKVQEGVRKPTYQLIQAAVGPSVQDIVRRASLGDYSLIGAVKSSYQDFVNAPRSLAEVHEFLKKSVDTFNELPVDFKAAFDNSPNVFRKAVQEGTFENKVKSVLDKRMQVKQPKKEVKEDEQK